MLRQLLSSALFFLFIFTAQSQVGIGTTNPDPSSILDIATTDKGLLIPRLTTAQRDAIANPANGLMIYNTDANAFQFNANTSGPPQWEVLTATSTSTGMPGESVKYSNTDITTNINANPAIELPIFGTQHWNDNNTLYTVSGNRLTITEAGRYQIIANVSLENSNGERNPPEIRIGVNGIPIGPISSTGYIRDRNYHVNGSLHINEVLELNANDIITISTEQSANNGSVLLRSTGTSTFYIEKRR
ncbi:MAG: hypothetical protein CMC08_08925 [Flavobacteriaceae bacterium]|nr:hypothetical protein [Flavobacteriaceae bacterium]